MNKFNKATKIKTIMKKYFLLSIYQRRSNPRYLVLSTAEFEKICKGLDFMLPKQSYYMEDLDSRDLDEFKDKQEKIDFLVYAFASDAPGNTPAEEVKCSIELVDFLS